MHDTQAVISIGTNSTRLLLVDFAAKRFGVFGDPSTRILKQRSVGTRIGEGIKESGHIREDAMQRTLGVVRDYMESIRSRVPHPYVIATSALRRADNADHFTARVREITGSDLAILDGDEEARASFRGAVVMQDEADEMRVGVLDVGGGSTEYATGEHEHADHTASCEIGAVRLTERFPQLDGEHGWVDNATIERAREFAAEELMPLRQFDSVQSLITVGGTATTALAVIKGHRGPFGEMRINREGLTNAFNTLCELTLEKRRSVPGMNPQRADILPGGILILLTALELVHQESALVSHMDLLFGYLLLKREDALVIPHPQDRGTASSAAGAR